MSHTNGKPSKDTIGLEYGTQEDLPKCSNNFPLASDLDSDTDQSFTHSRTLVAMVDDVIPSTSLLWGEEHKPVIMRLKLLHLHLKMLMNLVSEIDSNKIWLD